jgi:heparan-alpha-glucosaminide N-acetyltransferase
MTPVLTEQQSPPRISIAATHQSEAPVPKVAGDRYVSLDAYRGFIMLMLVSHAFGLNSLRDQPGWHWLAAQFEHVEWEGLVFWDLIQPAFMFMVGMAMPFAFANRSAKGDSAGQIFRHVAWRALVLIVLSQVLIDISGGKLQFQLINVLSQIAFTYFFTFLILRLPTRFQVLAALVLLAGHWVLFALFPGPEGAFSKTGNIGARIDQALLGYNYSGLYVTINFVTSTVTTLLGAWTALFLMRKKSHTTNLKVILLSSAFCFASGRVLSIFNPMVKRLWTTSFTFYSAGWVFLMLAAFYWLVEVRGWRKPMFPLLILGMNSIFVYSVSMVLYSWLDRAVGVFSGRFAFAGVLSPVFQATAVLMVMWYLCYWLYKRKIFLRI